MATRIQEKKEKAKRPRAIGSYQIAGLLLKSESRILPAVEHCPCAMCYRHGPKAMNGRVPLGRRLPMCRLLRILDHLSWRWRSVDVAVLRSALAVVLVVVLEKVFQCRSQFLCT